MLGPVAIVAVHGVADRKPGASAQAIIRLLTKQDPRFRHIPHQDQNIEIPICSRRALSLPLSRDPHVQLMEQHLSNYVPTTDEATYQTRRLVCARTNDHGDADEVHVYECYWDDLSGISAGGVRILARLFEVLLNLAVISGRGLQHAASAEGNPRLWGTSAYLHDFAVWGLVVVVPVFQLLLFGVVAANIPLPLSQNGLSAAADLMVLVGLVFSAEQLATKTRAKVVLSVASALCYLLWRYVSVTPDFRTSALLCYAGAVLCLTGVVLRYSREHRSAPFVWLAATSVLGIALFVHAGELVTLDSAFEVGAQVAMLLRRPFLLYAWTGTLISALLFCCVGYLNAYREPSATRSRAIGALNIAIAGFSVSALLFSVTILAVWGVIAGILSRVSPDSPVTHGIISVLEVNSPVFFVLLLSLVASVAMLSGVLYVAVSEWRPPQNEDIEAAQVHGRKIDTTFTWMRRSGGTNIDCRSCCFANTADAGHGHRRSVVGLSAGILKAVHCCSQRHWGVTDRTVRRTRDHHSQDWCFFDLLRPIVSVASDITAFMKDSPQKSTTRAKICVRFISLLHFLTRQNAGASYSSIIFVAHSQGSVICADSLRFCTARQVLSVTVRLSLCSLWVRRFDSCTVKRSQRCTPGQAMMIRATSPQARYPIWMMLNVRTLANLGLENGSTRTAVEIMLGGNCGDRTPAVIGGKRENPLIIPSSYHWTAVPCVATPAHGGNCVSEEARIPITGTMSLSGMSSII